jgi:hypothetical protein
MVLLVVARARRALCPCAIQGGVCGLYDHPSATRTGLLPDLETGGHITRIRGSLGHVVQRRVMFEIDELIRKCKC